MRKRYQATLPVLLTLLHTCFLHSSYGNLLPNGDLHNNTSGWVLSTHGGSKAVLGIEKIDEKSMLSVQVENGGTQLWDVQLEYYCGLNLQEGKSYLFEADVIDKNASRSIAIFFGTHGNEYTPVADVLARSPQNKYQRISHIFYVTKQSDKLRLVIGNLGQTGATFYVGNVSLQLIAGDKAAQEARQLAKDKTTEKKPYDLFIDPFPRQEVKGWGSMVVGNHDWRKEPPHLEQKEAVRLYYGLGQTFVRTTLRHDTTYDENGNYEAWQDLPAMLRVAQEHGITNYIMATWSPPPQFKTTKSPQGFIDENKSGKWDPSEPISQLKPECEDDFIDWYVGAIKALGKEGFPPPLNISVQNEPNEIVPYEGCFYDAVQWARVVKKMRVALDEAGYEKVEIIGPDSNYGMVTKIKAPTEQPGYLKASGFPILGEDPELNKAIGAYAFHSYNMSNMEGVSEGVANFPKEVWMTESSEAGGSNEITWALYITSHFLADMIVVPANYWTFWSTLEVNDKPLTTFSMVVVRSDGTIHLTKKFRALRWIFNTVRPGWTVHRLLSNHPKLRSDHAGQDHWVNLELGAFVSPDRQRTAVVIVNNESRADDDEFTLRGLTGKSADIYKLTERTNPDKAVESVPINDGAISLKLTKEIGATFIVTNP